MSRRNMRSRIKRLEDLIPLLPPDPARFMDFVLELRSNGVGPGNEFAQLLGEFGAEAASQSLGIAEYCIYDEPTVIYPGAWAAQHGDHFIRLVGQLVHGNLNVLTHAGANTRSLLRLPPDFDWVAEIDPIDLDYLAEMSWDHRIHDAYWRQVREGSWHTEMLGYYLAYARQLTRREAEEADPEHLEEDRQTLAARRDWILAQDQDDRPDEIPWLDPIAAKSGNYIPLSFLSEVEERRAREATRLMVQSETGRSGADGTSRNSPQRGEEP